MSLDTITHKIAIKNNVMKRACHLLIMTDNVIIMIITVIIMFININVPHEVQSFEKQRGGMPNFYIDKKTTVQHFSSVYIGTPCRSEIHFNIIFI